MNVDVAELQNAYELLFNAFSWSDSPQGFYYWYKVSENIKDFGIKNENVTVELDSGVDVEKCEEFIDSLVAAFTWIEAPQGYQYWVSVNSAVISIRNNAVAMGPTKDPIKAYDRAMKGI